MFQLNILKNKFKRIKYPLFLSCAIYLIAQWVFSPLKERNMYEKNIQNYASYPMFTYRYNS